MKKATSKLLLIFFCMSFLMIIPMKANAAENIPVNISVEYGQTEARSILDMINEMRTNRSDAWYWNIDDTTKTTCNNLGELAYDYDLERLAMQRAAEIALSYDHTRPNGDRCFSIYKEKGITYSHAGENIAAGYNSAEAVHMGWREDNENYAGQGHRRNMLSSDYNCIGIGHVYYNGFHYWVEEFAYRPSVNTTKTTANDSKQTATVSVAKSNITKLTVSFDEDLSTLRIGETVTPDITAIIDVTNHWGGKGIVADLPTISVENSSIATYSNRTISGIAEGTTKLTASLYGLAAANTPTVSVHSCDNHWDDGKITTEPTCIKKGEKTFTCSICGGTKTTKINATGHSYGEYVIVKAPTNSEKGLKSKTCSTCGKVYSVTIPKVNSVTTPKEDSSETNTEQNIQTSQQTTKKIKLNRRKLTLKKGKTFKLKVTLTPESLMYIAIHQAFPFFAIITFKLFGFYDLHLFSYMKCIHTRIYSTCTQLFFNTKQLVVLSHTL